MQFHLAPYQLEPRFAQFKLNNEIREITHMDLADIKRHFVDWLRIQLKTKKNETDRNNRRPTKEERDAEFAAHIAAKLARCK